MTGHRKWSEIRATSAREDRLWRQAEIQGQRETVRLDELRRCRKLSQEELAKRLKSHQAQISRLEQRADLFVSTLRRYVEALGGELEIVASFPDGTVRIDNFREIANGHPRTHETPAAKRRELVRKRGKVTRKARERTGKSAG